jgi:3-oxoacyl-[acyl-carrier protein] reductase
VTAYPRGGDPPGSPRSRGGSPPPRPPLTRCRVALVTGCGKRDGVGQGVARTLAASGIAVVVADKEPTGVLNRRQEVVGVPDDGWQGVVSLTDEIISAGAEASCLLGDISDESDAERMVAEAAKRHGRLDILVNNAAAPQGPDRADIEDVPVDVWDRVIRVNLRGTYLMSRFAVPVMRGQRYGRIINIASMAGVVSAPRSTAYSASKAAVLGFTRALSADVAPWGITVNAIAPGMVATSRAILSEDPALDVAAEIERRGRAIAVGRPGYPDDIAAAVAYLASEAAGYMTGQTLVLDGGGISRFPLSRPPDTVQPSR